MLACDLLSSAHTADTTFSGTTSPLQWDSGAHQTMLSSLSWTCSGGTAGMRTFCAAATRKKEHELAWYSRQGTGRCSFWVPHSRRAGGGVYYLSWWGLYSLCKNQHYYNKTIKVLFKLHKFLSQSILNIYIVSWPTISFMQFQKLRQNFIFLSFLNLKKRL